jgi:putative ABC transport system permease protein
MLNPESHDFRPLPVERPQTLEPGHSSLPSSFITPDGLRAHGWEFTRIGWLVEGDAAFTDEQLAVARELAVDADLLIEPHTDQADLGDLRTAATVAGIALALAVLAMTVGLTRAESGRDLRILTATGATSGTRRWLTSATAGGLAVPGVALGIAGAYLTLGASYADDLSRLQRVPAAHLLLIAIGIPTMAAIAGWLAAGRQPHTLTHHHHTE